MMPPENQKVPGQNPSFPVPPGLEGFSPAQIMQMMQSLQNGEIPPELAEAQKNWERGMDKNGKPLLDEEGGAIITPDPGYVVKTQDQSGQKVFVNMVQHDLVDPFEEKEIPDSDERGIRIPLSLGPAREERDKQGNMAQVYDCIWNPDTIIRAKDDPAFRQIMVELAFNYIQQKN